MVRSAWSRPWPASMYTSSSWLRMASCLPFSSASVSSGTPRPSTIWRITTAKNGWVSFHVLIKPLSNLKNLLTGISELWTVEPSRHTTSWQAPVFVHLWDIGVVIHIAVYLWHTLSPRPTMTARSLSTRATLRSSWPSWWCSGLTWSFVRPAVTPFFTRAWSEYFDCVSGDGDNSVKFWLHKTLLPHNFTRLNLFPSSLKNN